LRRLDVYGQRPSLIAALMLAINQIWLAFSLKISRLSNMTFSFYSYAWRFMYRINRVRVAIV
jgi:hypothetical protein